MQMYLNSTMQTVAWFVKTNNDGELEMGPTFQRRLVWTDRQKSYLVDSVLRGYPIPELYLQEKMSPDGRACYVVVDGQQRLNSIFEFYRGELSLEASETEPRWAERSFEELSPEDKRNFFSYKFVIRMLPDVGDDEIRAIFMRINKNNEALNAQELRQSLYSGAFIRVVNEIADKDYWAQTGIFTPRRIRRMEDVESVSEMAIAYLNGPQNKKTKLDYYYTLYEESFEQESELVDVFDSSVQEILAVLPGIKKTRWKKLSDFYSLFLVFAGFRRDGALPFSSDVRDAIGEALLVFGSTVDAIQREQSNPNSIDPGLKAVECFGLAERYASGIRNSADMNSRIARQSALQDYLEPLLG